MKNKSEKLEKALAALLLKITRGGIEGNPWSCPQVFEAAQVLADIEGHGDKYKVDLDRLASGKVGVQ